MIPADSVDAALTESTARFIVVSNVLIAVANYARQCADTPALREAEARTIAGSYRAPQRRSLSERHESLLRIAWQTELAARVSHAFDDPSLRRVGAQTLPVHAYYAIFSAARALTDIAGSPRDTHRGAHDDFASQRAVRAAGPWSVTFNGDPEDLATCAVSPPICVPQGFNLLELGHRTELYVAAGLRMTRRWKLDLARTDWLRKNKKRDGTPYRRLPPAARAALVDILRPTTLLDLLYELRRRTNYESVDEYGSDATDAHVLAFHDGLLYMVDAGLLLYEMQIADYVGHAALHRAAEKWSGSVRRLGEWAGDPLSGRLAAIAAAR